MTKGDHKMQIKSLIRGIIEKRSLSNLLTLQFAAGGSLSFCAGDQWGFSARYF